MAQSLLFKPEFKRDWPMEDSRLVKPHQLHSLATWVANTPELFFDYECDTIHSDPFMVGFYAPDKGAKIVDFRLVGDAGKAAVADGLARRQANQRTVAFNIDFELEKSRALGFNVGGSPWDPMHAAFAVNEVRQPWGEYGPFSQKALTFHVLGITPKFAQAVKLWLENNFGVGAPDENWSLVPASLMFYYNCEDVETGWALHKKLEAQVVANDQVELVQTDSIIADYVGAMERRGMPFDSTRAAELADQYLVIQRDAHRTAFEALGYEVDFGAQQKLFGLLYGDFRLPYHADQEKKGKLDDDVLSWMLTLPQLTDKQRTVIECVQTITEMEKLRDTYLLPWQYEHSRGGLLYPNLNMRGARTRRFSAANPNLQNVPTRTEFGNALRSAFIARQGWTVYAMDQSQAEYRAFAHYARAESLIKGYMTDPNFDIHREVSAWLDVDRDKEGKHLNFAQLYGVGIDKLSRKLLRAKAEAQRLLDMYHRRLPEVNRHKRELEQYVRTHGYVRDMFNGRRHLSLQESYKAINSECQMTVANLIRLNLRLATPIVRAAGGHMLLQVHDELLFELPGTDTREHLPTLRRMKQEAMECKTPSRVPWRSDVERWGGPYVKRGKKHVALFEGQGDGVDAPTWQNGQVVEL